MTKYDTMNVDELVNILNARDTEIEILSHSCQRLLEEKFNLQNSIAEMASDLGLEIHEIVKSKKSDKDPDSGFEGSTLFPKGQGRLVVKNDCGTIHIWD